MHISYDLPVLRPASAESAVAAAPLMLEDRLGELKAETD